MRRRPICVALGSLCCFGAMAGLQPVHAQQLTIQRPLLEWASEVQVATPATVASKPAEVAPMAPAVTRQATAPVQVASSIPVPAAPVEPVAPTQVSLMPAAAPPAPARTIAATAPVKSTPPAPQPAPVVPALRTAVRETAAPVPVVPVPAAPAVPTAVTLVPAAMPPTPVRIVAAITPAKSTPPAPQPALQPAPKASVAPAAARQTMAPINVSQPALPPEPAAPAVPTTVTLIPATAPPTPAHTIAATAPATSMPPAPQPAPQPQSAPTASVAPAVARQVMAPVNVSQPVLPPVPEAPPTVAPIPAAAPPRAAVAVVRTPLNLAMPRTASGKGDDFSMRQTAMSAPDRQQSIAGDGGDSLPTAAAKAMPRQVLNTGQIKTADAASARFAQWLAATEDTDAEQMVPRMDEATLRQMLYRAVEQAAHNSPQVRQAHAEYEAALADIDEAKGQRWPQLNVGTNSKAVSLGGGSANNDTGAGVTVNMTTSVFDWGRNSKTIASREQLALAARQRYESELDASAFLVSSNMVELAKNRLLVDISQQYVDRMGMLVSMLQEIVAVDRGRGSELTQAKARLLQAESNRDSVAAKVSEFQLNLRKLLGDGQIPSLPGRVWPLQPANLGVMLATVSEHPSIKQAEAETEAAELNVGAIKAASRPALNWVVSKSTSRDTLGREQPVQTMLSLNWAAFSGGSQRAQQAAATQRAVASREKKGQQLLDLEYRVRTADQNARTSLARADLYHNLTAETDGVRKAFFEQWYHLAKRTLLDVLSAESDHYNNRVSEINSRFDGYQSIFQEYNGAGQLASWLRGTPSR